MPKLDPILEALVRHRLPGNIRPHEGLADFAAIATPDVQLTWANQLNYWFAPKFLPMRSRDILIGQTILLECPLHAERVLNLQRDIASAGTPMTTLTFRAFVAAIVQELCKWLSVEKPHLIADKFIDFDDPRADPDTPPSPVPRDPAPRKPPGRFPANRFFRALQEYADRHDKPMLLDEAYLKLSRYLFRCARSWDLDRETADDLVQSAAVRLIAQDKERRAKRNENAAEMTNEKPIEKPFLYALGVLRHLWFDRFRKGSTEESLSDDTLFNIADDPFSDDGWTLRFEQVMATLKASRDLTDVNREILIARHCDGLTSSEVVQKLAYLRYGMLQPKREYDRWASAIQLLITSLPIARGE